MHSKSFTFGLGVGILIVSAVFYMLVNWLGIGAPAQYTQEDIIQMAQEMGLELVQELQEPEEIDEVIVYENEQLTEEDSYTNGGSYDYYGDIESADGSINEYESTMSLSDTNSLQEVSIYIPENSMAAFAAEVLAENEIIENADDFINYLVRNRMDDRVMAGYFTLRKGLSLEELADMLIVNNYR